MNRINVRKRRLQAVRKAAGFTTKELAKHLGVGENKIVQFERGTFIKSGNAIEAVNKWYLNEIVKYIGEVKPWVNSDKMNRTGRYEKK